MVVFVFPSLLVTQNEKSKDISSVVLLITFHLSDNTHDLLLGDSHKVFNASLVFLVIDGVSQVCNV